MGSLLEDPEVTRRELEQVDAIYKKLCAAIGDQKDPVMVLAAVQLFVEMVLRWGGITIEQFVRVVDEQKKERPRG